MAPSVKRIACRGAGGSRALRAMCKVWKKTDRFLAAAKRTGYLERKSVFLYFLPREIISTVSFH